MNKTQSYIKAHTVLLQKALFTVVTVSVISLSPFVAANTYNSSSLSLSIDNDGLLGTDKDYTNGTFIKYSSKSTPVIKSDSPFVLETLGNILPLNKGSNKSWGLSLGQKIWTPTDITVATEEEDSRPYTGFLFLNVNVSEYSPSYANKYNILLGAVGPDAFGENAQSAVHSIIGSKKPQGWDKQIQNQTVANLGYEGHRLLKRDEDNTYDMSISGRINAGNFQSELAIGSAIRWGNALNESFASVGSMPGNYIDPSALGSSASGQFYYVAIEGRYRFNDITIDGARPEHLFDVHTQPIQATLSTGAVYYKEKWGAALSIITSSPDYKEDTQAYNSTASLEFFWRS